MFRANVVLSVLFSAITLISSIPANAGSDWLTRPGTIAHAMTLPNGAHVHLDTVIIDKIKAHQRPAYLVVHEWWDSASRIIVVAQPSKDLRPRQAVDVEGTLGNLPNGERAVLDPKITGYMDRAGNLGDSPVVKGLLGPTAWPWKTDLSSSSSDASSAKSVVSTTDDETLLAPEPPTSTPLAGATYYATIDDLLAANPPDGTVVELQCKPIVLTGTDPTYGNYFVMGEDSASGTLKTYYTSAITGTDRVNKVSGQLTTEGTARVLCVNGGPGYDPQVHVGVVQTAAQGTIAWAKTLADGTYLTSSIPGKVVSRVFTGEGAFYIQELDRSTGIRVADQQAVLTLKPGDTVTVSNGQMATVDGERCIDTWGTAVQTSGDSPRPVGVVGRSLGGGGFNSQAPGPAGGFGLNNTGLLTTTWGKVTSVGDGFFYLDDGSSLDDGTGSLGTRVRLPGGYLPQQNDCVMVTGVSGLATLDTSLARIIRVASDTDILLLSRTRPPVGLTAISSGSGKITVYWNGVPGATGYNVYRGTASGQEDYQNPINSTLITTPTHPGSNAYMFTDTGLTNWTEYYYTLKSVGPAGLSEPSDEVSEMASPYAIPWDSGNAADIVSAVQANFYGTFDYIRAVGPDGTVYDSDELTPQAPSASLIPSTDILALSTGWMLPLPNDEGQYNPDSGGMGLMALAPSDGAYRRVKSMSWPWYLTGYTGCRGRFVLPCWPTCMYVSGGTRDTLYVYLGGDNSVAATDAGVYFETKNNLNVWRAFHATTLRGGSYSTVHLWNYALKPYASRDFASGASVNMTYYTLPDSGMTTLIVSGWSSDWLAWQTVCIANAYPVKAPYAAAIKRVHSIAQGRIPGQPVGFQETGSYMWHAEVHDMALFDTYYSPVSWGTGETAEEGSYPGWPWVTWRVISPYTDEDQIMIEL